MKHAKEKVMKHFLKVEKSMPPSFLRVHNSWIIHMDKIIKVEDQHVSIGQEKIPIGKKYESAFKAYLEKNQL